VDAGLRMIYSSVVAFEETPLGACINWWPESHLAALMDYTNELGLSFHSTDALNTTGSRYRLINQPERQHTAQVSMLAIERHGSLADALSWARENNASSLTFLDWMEPTEATYSFMLDNPF
jgi:hypothetical protein